MRFRSPDNPVLFREKSCFQEQAVFCEIVWMRDFSAVQVLTMTEKGGTIRNESVVTEMPDCLGVRNNSLPAWNKDGRTGTICA